MKATFTESQYEAAGALGVSVQTFRNWVKQGRFKKTRRGWNVTRIKAWRDKNLAPPSKKRGDAHADPSVRERLLEAQTREREARAALAGLRLAIERGEYRSLKEIEEWDRARIAIVKRGLLQLGRSLAPSLAGLDVRQVEALVTKRCRELLTRFGRMK